MGLYCKNHHDLYSLFLLKRKFGMGPLAVYCVVKQIFFFINFSTFLQLLVYGPGQVIPSSLNILEPNLKYSLVVGLSSSVQYGRVILVMDKNFCSDAAGNRFLRTENSSLYVRIGE